MVKYSFLENLNENQLREIAKKEGLKNIPKNYEREDLIKYLEGTLTIEKSKKYEKIYLEREVERDIHIHEKIKERSLKSSYKETNKITITREKQILDLMKMKIHKEVLKVLANRLNEKEPEGSKQEIFEEMSDDLRQKTYEIFVELKSDKTGRNFEYFCANWLMNEENIKKIDIDHKFEGIGEIDIVGFDDKMLPLVIAECKDKKVLKEDIDKWITNTINLYDKYSNKIDTEYDGKIHLRSFFFTSERITPEVLERYKNHKVKDNGVYQKIPVISPKAYLFIYEVKKTKFERKFPQKEK